jgi:hypothetical protein
MLITYLKLTRNNFFAQPIYWFGQLFELKKTTNYYYFLIFENQRWRARWRARNVL